MAEQEVRADYKGICVNIINIIIKGDKTMTNYTNFKIGDKVEFGKKPNAPTDEKREIVGAGEILSLHIDYPIEKSWIVLITRRDTEFLKNKPEKALIVFDSQMRLLEDNNHKFVCSRMRVIKELPTR